MKDVLRRPTAEEVDDYKEYKRIGREVRSSRNTFTRAKPLVKSIDTESPSVQARRQSQANNERLHLLQYQQQHSQSQSKSPFRVNKPGRLHIPATPVLRRGPLTPPLTPRSGLKAFTGTYTEGADDKAARTSIDLGTLGLHGHVSTSSDFASRHRVGSVGKTLAKFGI